MTHPDPRNVRDALLEAGYAPMEVERMLAAAEGRYVSVSEEWTDATLLAHRPEIRPTILDNTRARLARALADRLLKDGYLEQHEERDESRAVLRMTTTLRLAGAPRAHPETR